MSKKTLPDELRSVLLAHSLDAPEPDDTVDRILAATVGGSVAESTSPKRWWASYQLLAAAVVVGVLVLGVAGFALHHRSSQQQAASNSAAGAAQRGVNGPLYEPSTGAGRLGKNNGSNQSQLAVPAPTPPTDLPCTSIPGGYAAVGAHASFTLTSTGESRYVYEFLCIGDNGQRSGSEVQVFDRLGGKLHYLSTLAKATGTGGLHVDYLAALPNGVRIQGTDQPEGGRPGDAVSISYTTADGGKTFTSTGKLVAKACQKADLSARVVAADGGVTGQHKVLQVTNLTPNPCVLEGFPNLVTLINGTPAGPILVPTMYGPAGGVIKSKVPPIVVLIPGGTAGAIIEPASDHPTCSRSNQLAVTLPNHESLGLVPAELATCGLEVHPLVDNPYGTD